MDKVSKERRSQIMRAIRSKNTIPELSLRNGLWAKGLRYRIHYGKERIDIAFPSEKIAVFVDGCFWHRCPLHSHVPKSNRDYWRPKLEENVERDKGKEERLKLQGWTIVRIWEHELREPNRIAAIVENIGKLKKGS